MRDRVHDPLEDGFEVVLGNLAAGSVGEDALVPGDEPAGFLDLEIERAEEVPCFPEVVGRIVVGAGAPPVRLRPDEGVRQEPLVRVPRPEEQAGTPY